jgi:hypothetical protein
MAALGTHHTSTEHLHIGAKVLGHARPMLAGLLDPLVSFSEVQLTLFSDLGRKPEFQTPPSVYKQKGTIQPDRPLLTADS